MALKLTKGLEHVDRNDLLVRVMKGHGDINLNGGNQDTGRM